MGLSIRLIVTTALAALVLLGGLHVLGTPGLKPVVVSIYEPPIAVAEQRIRNVGAVETDSKVNAEYLIYNKGGKHLRITEVETTCGCTVADVSKRVIAPGEFTRISVALDTSIKLGPVRKKITVHSNDPARPALALFLEGDVKPKKMATHDPIMLKAKDPLVLFKGECATCHVTKGKGKSGKALFLADCAMCHGNNAKGHGNAGPSLLTGDYTNEAVVAHVRKVIAEGSPNSPQMPPFSKAKGGPLTDEEIASLVQFLKFQSTQDKLGLLDKPDPAELEDEAAFQEALKQPH